MVRLLGIKSDAIIDLYKCQTFGNEPQQERISINYDEYLELRNAYVKGFENINTIL